jgi:hypothetical protein
MKMKTEQEIEKYIAEQKVLQQRQKEVKTERLHKIIAAENLLTKISNDFIDFLKVNENRLIGKKIVNNNGMSKYWSTIFKEFVFSTPESPIYLAYVQGSNLKLRANFSGGSYEDRTYYCDYIDRTVYNIFNVDMNGVCTSVREEHSDYPMYEMEDVLTAFTKIAEYNKIIDDAQQKIRNWEKALPYYIHVSNHKYEVL